MLDEWTVNQSFKAVKNPDYWGTDADGNQLPYLARSEYRPVPDGAQRVNLLQSGEVDVIHTATASQIDSLRSLGDDIDLIESDAYGEVGYFMLNTAPDTVFSSLTARQAAAHAIDRERLNAVRGLDIPTIAAGPFGHGRLGFLAARGSPKTDPEKDQERGAKKRNRT